MSVADELYNGAVETIRKLGNPGKLVEVVQGEYNPDTTERERVEVEHDIYYVETGYKQVETETGIDGPADIMLTFATELAVKDDWNLLTYAGIRCYFLEVKKTAVLAKVVLYEVKARKSF